MRSNLLSFLRDTSFYPNQIQVKQNKTKKPFLYSSHALYHQSSDFLLSHYKIYLLLSICSFPSLPTIIFSLNSRTLLPSCPTSIPDPLQIILCTQSGGNFCNGAHTITLLNKTLNGFPLPSKQTQKHSL